MALTSKDKPIKNVIINRLNISELNDKTKANTISDDEFYAVYNEPIDSGDFLTLDEAKALPISTFQNDMRYFSRDDDWDNSNSFKVYDSKYGWTDCDGYTYDSSTRTFKKIESIATPGSYPGAPLAVDVGDTVLTPTDKNKNWYYYFISFTPKTSKAYTISISPEWGDQCYSVWNGRNSLLQSYPTDKSNDRTKNTSPTNVYNNSGYTTHIDNIGSSIQIGMTGGTEYIIALQAWSVRSYNWINENTNSQTLTIS